MHVVARHLLFLFIIFQLPALCFGQGNKQSVQNWNRQQLTRFTENKGQVTDQNGNLRSDVKFIYSAPGFKAVFKENSFSYEIYTKSENPLLKSKVSGTTHADYINKKKHEALPKITINTHRIDVSLPNARKHVDILAEGKSDDYNNYYLAHTPEEGIQKVYSYTKLTYKNVWPNIDIVFYAKNEGALKYDIIVHPGGKLSDVQFAYYGSDIQLHNNRLNISTTAGRIEESIPLSYTLQNNKAIDVSYKKEGNKVFFEGEYDLTNTLVIDPLISWATYYGGDELDVFQDIATDANANVFATGTTKSTASIATTGSFSTTYLGNYDALLVKFNSNGARVWGTYYGGSALDEAKGVATDRAGNVYMAGYTGSSTGLYTTGANQGYNGSDDGFIVKFNTNGSRKWGSYHGGSDYDEMYAVTVDYAGNVYMCGATWSNNYIYYYTGHQTAKGGDLDACIVKYDSTGTELWGSYYGGSDFDIAYDVTTDMFGNVYMCGNTLSNSGIATTGSYNSTYSGDDGYLVKFNPNGKRLWGTYISNAYSLAVSCDRYANVFMGGSTVNQYIATQGAHQTTYNNVGGYPDGFIAKFNSAGTRLWATYYGGESEDYILGMRCDTANNLYISGATLSTNGISSTGAIQKDNAGAYDAFIVKFTNSGTREWATYFGGSEHDRGEGIALDSAANVYVGGGAFSSSGISTSGAHQASIGSSGKIDGFLIKLTNDKPDAGIYTIDKLLPSYCGYTTKKIDIKLKNYSSVHLDSIYIGWSVNGKLQTPKKYLNLKSNETTDIYTLNAAYTFNSGKNILKIWTYKPNGVVDFNAKNDTASQTINFYPAPSVNFTAANTCQGNKVALTNLTSAAGDTIISYLWKFGDGDTSTAENPDKTYQNAGVYDIQLIVKSIHGCVDSLSESIRIYPRATPDFSFNNSCANASVTFINNSSISNSAMSFAWDFGDSTTSTLKNPVKKYAVPGNYDVKLIVTSLHGCKDSINKTVTVAPIPKANFSAASICLTDSAYFIDSSISATQYIWNFGDHTTSNKQNPSHKYAKAGTYHITLKVQNIYGCWDSISKPIEVFTRPQAIFSVSDICASDSFSLADVSKGASKWLWKFGDKNYSTDQNPTHKYASAGKYNIWLVVENINGCKDSVMHSISADSTCVWPGDANADKVVDNKDILAIGIAYNDTGYTRTDTSTTWEPHFAKNWRSNFSSGQNYKHADSDGNGIVDNWDTLAVTRNYTKTHAKKHAANRGKNTDPVLKVEIQNDSLKAADTLVAYIVLGENALPAKDVYGLAFTLNYNKELFFSPRVSFSANWFGKDAISYTNSTNALDIALTKTDHKNVTGAGQIAVVKLILKKDIDLTSEKLKLEITDNLLISKDGNIVEVNAVNDSVRTYKQPNSIFISKQLQPEITVYPNPFKEYIKVSYLLPEQALVKINICDFSGRIYPVMPLQTMVRGKHELTLRDESYFTKPGMYILKIEVDGVPGYVKIIKL